MTDDCYNMICENYNMMDKDNNMKGGPQDDEQETRHDGRLWEEDRGVRGNLKALAVRRREEYFNS